MKLLTLKRFRRQAPPPQQNDRPLRDAFGNDAARGIRALVDFVRVGGHEDGALTIKMPLERVEELERQIWAGSRVPDFGDPKVKAHHAELRAKAWDGRTLHYYGIYIEGVEDKP